MTEKDSNMPTKSSIFLYQTEDSRQRIEVQLENETIWLNQRLLSDLFQKDVRTINDISKTYMMRMNCPPMQLSGNSG